MKEWLKVGLVTGWALVVVCLLGCGAYDGPANLEEQARQNSNLLRGDPQATPADGLVAYWPFDGNAIDETGNGNDGIVHGATLTEDRCGRPSSAYSFDGVDDYIEVPHDPSLNFGTGDFTVCCWVQLAQLPQFGRIVGKMGAERTGSTHGDGYGYVLTIAQDGHPFANVSEAGVGPAVHSYASLGTGTWHFLAAVRRGGILSLFVDGEWKAEVVNANDTNSESTVGIGAKLAPGDERWLNGLIDDLRIYNRALGEEEIAALFVPCRTSVLVDIKPGTDVNPVNPGSRGVIPVAILTTSTAAGEPLDFDATTVDPLSVGFGPGFATEAHGTGHFEDVDGDGDIDLMLHFRVQETGIVCGDTECGLTGETLSGEVITGIDSIVTVGCE